MLLSSPLPASRNRLFYLDALRGLAVLSVLVFHMLASINVQSIVWCLSLFDFGMFGVCLFFIISGYVITLSLEHTPLRTFWIRRCMRLYPSYWLSIALVLVLYMLNWAHPFTPNFDTMPVWSVFANMTMLQTLFGIGSLLGVYWSLFYELVFYGLITMCFVCGIAHRSVYLASICFVCSLIADIIFPYLHMTIPINFSLFALMFTGVVVYRGDQQKVSSVTVLRVVLLCGLLLVCAPVPINTMLGRIAALLVFMWFTRVQWEPLILVWIGRISYSLYLLHEIVIAAVGYHGVGQSLLLWSSLSLACAWIVFRYVEQPCIRFGRRL